EDEPDDRGLVLVVAAAQLGHGGLEGGGQQQQPAEDPPGIDHGPGGVAVDRVLVGEAEVGDEQREHRGRDHRQVHDPPAAGAGEQHQRDGAGHDVAQRVGQQDGPLQGGGGGGGGGGEGVAEQGGPAEEQQGGGDQQAVQQGPQPGRGPHGGRREAQPPPRQPR